VIALIAALALALALAAAARPAAARADADPASDTLLIQNAFYPYQPRTSDSLVKALDGLTAQGAKSGFPLKVAIVGAAEDLGAVTALFGQPQRYADFLGQEISFNHKQALLVVMPQGFGTANVGSPYALKGLSVDSSGSDGLARSAIRAYLSLAAANGHPLKAPSASGGGASSSVSPLLAFGAPVALIFLAAGLVAVARRRQPDDEADEPKP
jgi:hypothetical protein